MSFFMAQRFLAYFGFALDRTRIRVPDFLATRCLDPSGWYTVPTRVGLFVDGSMSSTLDEAIGISFDSRPPCGLLRLGFRCREPRLIPWPVTLPFSRFTRRTLPRLPRSSPAITSTMSLTRMCMVGSLPERTLGKGYLLSLYGTCLRTVGSY